MPSITGLVKPLHTLLPIRDELSSPQPCDKFMPCTGVVELRRDQILNWLKNRRHDISKDQIILFGTYAVLEDY